MRNMTSFMLLLCLLLLVFLSTSRFQILPVQSFSCFLFLVPHIFVWGSCFWFCIPSAASCPPPPVASSRHKLCSHTTCPHTTSHHTTCHTTTCPHTTCLHNTCPHTTCHHTTCLHTTCPHTTLSTHNLSSHNLSSDHFSSHHLSSHYLSSHYLSTHNLALSSHHLLTHSLSSHDLSSIHLHFVWQAWHLMTWIVTLRGRRGTYGTGLALVARLVPRRRWDAAAFCVAGVALCDIHLHFVWAFCVAGVALRDIYLHFAWQAWHLWHGVGSGGALGPPWCRGAAAFCVAGVALRDICFHFVWQAWHLTTWIVTLRGRRTYGTGLALVARLVLGVAPGTPRLLAWQAWHLETSTFVSRGRRGTW